MVLGRLWLLGMLMRLLFAWLVLGLASCCKLPPPPLPPLAKPPNPGLVPAVATASAPAVTPDAKEDIAPEAATGFRHVDGVAAKKHMVAAANPHAANAALEMLRAGGSAVDAAVAIAMVLTLVEPQSSGIGGGAFMLHYDAKAKKITAFDGRETAPSAATGDMFLGADGKPRNFFDAVIGGLSVGVPGELRMLEMAHKRHGKLPWKRLFQPAIQLAEKGFALSPRLHRLLKGMSALRSMKKAGPYFYQADGTPKPVGTQLVNKELATVFRAIADKGADAFYVGDIARDIVDAVRKASRNPGRLSLADMKAYKAVAREPVCLPYRTYHVCGMPPPTSGGITTLQILGLLQRFELSKHDPDSLEVAHLFAEAGRLAYADRGKYIADPDFVKVPTAGLLHPTYLAERSKLIDPKRAMGNATPGTPKAKAAKNWAEGLSADLPSTSHMVVVDSAGNAVSMTASIESAFGSHLMVKGFLLNNELTDFSFVAKVDGRDVANRVQPGKRPRSSMAPILVLDPATNGFVMAVGSPGGSRIITYVARVLIGVLDHALHPQVAIGRPNVVNRNGITELEKGDAWKAWLARTKAGLEGLGHQVGVRDLNSGLHAIKRTADGYIGGADPRREGVVVGD
jgi:gamma-glutamyltranspeptidase/glutathione hydrolase